MTRYASQIEHSSARLFMITIRKFESQDQAQVRSLIDSIMSKEFSDVQQAYPLDDLDEIPETYGGVGQAFFVGIDGDEVVGTVGIKKEDERTALLRRIFVRPEFRNRRYGMRLLEEAIHFCAVVGYQEVIFKTTSRMKGAIGLCEKKGFAEKARLDLGGIEIYKFALFLKENSPLA